MPDNAAIYIADPSLMGSKLFDRIEGVRSYHDISDDDTATGVRFVLQAGQVTMNFMPEDQVAQHLNGFSAFAQRAIDDRNQLLYALSRIQYVRLVCGCIITPRFDDNDTIQDFLLAFTRATNGLLFLADTIFDYDGEALGGRFVSDH